MLNVIEVGWDFSEQRVKAPVVAKVNCNQSQKSRSLQHQKNRRKRKCLIGAARRNVRFDVTAFGLQNNTI